MIHIFRYVLEHWALASNRGKKYPSIELKNSNMWVVGN